MAAFSALFERTAALMERRHRIRHESLVGQVTAFVDREYGNRNLCLKFIAAELGMSANYLGRLFHKVTATSITDYVAEVRMNVAKKLLAESSLTIAEISVRVGFTNDGYFYKAFKRAHGVTPWSSAATPGPALPAASLHEGAGAYCVTVVSGPSSMARSMRSSRFPVATFMQVSAPP